ncbi:pseudouridine synthase [Streptomyces somaliensis DSM 40738]|uniref:RNA pseudouridylate synthase n=1 Tax=Streptomyces somaliensis (strain ATCC 33201 / DSM 40738 / JCM 12659 / KCTC 9044 / NCTC 11332 / NRRL B-12077 / IP 733) TaxID=1134445 RepID=A0AA44DDL6_STRE0|nr:pseudouridine synthase [Streptomyces somaliensis]MCQ0022097.1 pseudouridine synthase [Streptomyces somaliensis DSM 40738]NKY14968.1 pseudouridylate synthase [Streptomyces somaliensis DSM 40738]
MGRRRARGVVGPLEQRDGVDAVRVRLPAGEWASLRDHLVERYGRAVGAARVDAMLTEGAFVGADGRPAAGDEPYTPGRVLWFHRELPPEEPVPFEVGVVHRDERIVVADKPHFLATTPRGRHVAETALARLRRDLGLPHLQPAHRLDRLTAGLVLFVVRPEDRGAYQTLFRDRRVRKEYEALAPYDPGVALPATVRSHIVKERGVVAAYEVPGAVPNSESRIGLVERRGGLARYRLVPRTGRTHQLRVHMSALGVPILDDPLYPVVREDGPEDHGRPLRLLARALEFTDPFGGSPVRFESRLRLAWPG